MFFWTLSGSDPIQVTLNHGIVEGVMATGIYGHKYYRFEGIPYAKPPLGPLRFKAPQPAEPWDGIRICNRPANKPLQINHENGETEGSEDCLYLNVYTKYLYCPVSMPVMVFIYGGSYSIGEASRELYSPDYFMFKDVVFVTFNYRLSALGFLSLADPKLQVPGNAGLKDQIMALNWIRNNIEAFAGDSSNITVFGMSAGSAATHYLMSCELARGLFQKAILMSGCMLNYWANTPQKDFAYRLAKLRGYGGDHSEEKIFNFLNSLDAKELVDYSLLTNDEIKDGYIFSFGPVVEPYIGPDTVVSKEPLDQLRTSWGNHIPIMIGAASFEGLVAFPIVQSHPAVLKMVKEQPHILLPPDIRKQRSEERCLKMSELVIKQHFGEKCLSKGDCTMEYLDLISYRTFWHGIHRTTLVRLLNGRGATFLYRFDFDSPKFNQQRFLLCGHAINKGVAHADELSYLFFNKRSYILNQNSEEFMTIKRMISIWTAFAATSNPNCKEIESVHWKPLKAEKPFKALNIARSLNYADLPEKSKLEIWDSFYKPENLC